MLVSPPPTSLSSRLVKIFHPEVLLKMLFFRSKIIACYLNNLTMIKIVLSSSLHLKEEARDFLEPDTIKDLVKKYSQFINFNIYLWTSKTEEVEEPVEEEAAEEKKADEAAEDKKDEEKEEEKKDEEKEDKDDDAEVEEESEEKEKKPKTKKVCLLHVNKLVTPLHQFASSPHCALYILFVTLTRRI